MPENNRRQLVKGLVAGTAWSTPVVHSMVLPAHATTSIFCGSASAFDSGGDSDADAVVIDFDCESCTVTASEFTDVFPVTSDTVAMIDLDDANDDPANWDGFYPGGPDGNVDANNWTISNWSGNPFDEENDEGDSPDNGPGILTFTATRNAGSCAGQSFDFTVEIEISGDSPANMTVSASYA